MLLRKMLVGLGLGLAGPVVFAGTALADHCTNADKPPTAGNQVVLNAQTDEIEFANAGVQNKIDSGKIDPATGEGFHGHLGLDFNGDGAADAQTYIVGPNDALPDTAIDNGSPDHGIVPLGG